MRSRSLVDLRSAGEQVEAVCRSLEGLARSASPEELGPILSRVAGLGAVLQARLSASLLPKGSTNPRDPLPRFLDIKGAVEYLKLSKSTILRAVKAGALPSVRPTPGTLKFDREDLDRYMRERRSVN